jgi:hypothetical protein
MKYLLSGKKSNNRGNTHSFCLHRLRCGIIGLSLLSAANLAAEIPTVNPIDNVKACNGTTPARVDFTSNQPGTNYRWVVKGGTSRLGIPLSGTTSFINFPQLNNPTTDVISETIAVTPYNNEATGDVMEFSVIVLPTPTVNNPGNIWQEAGKLVTIEFTGTAHLFQWTSSNPAIGTIVNNNILFATNGKATWQFTAQNPGTGQIQSKITVKPVYSSNGLSCDGETIEFYIIIASQPTLNEISDKTACEEENVPAFTPPGLPSGEGYYITWSGGEDIGLLNETGTNRSRNIPAFTAKTVNSTTTTREITVTPWLEAMSGTPVQFTFTVYPAPSVNPIEDILLEPGEFTLGKIAFTGNASAFEWTSNNTAIGCAASGTALATDGKAFMAAFPAQNSTTAPLQSKITVRPVFSSNNHRCEGTPTEFTITVASSLPAVNEIPDKTACEGENVPAFTPSGLPSKEGYYITWSGGEDIGLLNETGANRSRSISAFTAKTVNSTTTSREITVTPWRAIDGQLPQQGTPEKFTFTVYPGINLEEDAGDTVTINRCSNNIAEVLQVEAGGDHLHYQWYKDQEAINDATEKTYTARAEGTYYAVVTDNCENRQQSRSYEIRIQKPIVKQHWGDVMILVTNPEDNGGYTFSNIQWCQLDPEGNLTEIPGATLSYLYSETPVEGITYVVKAKTQDGASYETCPVTGTAYDPPEIQIYPNPVKRGGTVTVEFPGDDWKNTAILLLSIDGKEITSLSATKQAESVPMPDTQGIYILKLMVGRTDAHEYKIMVR